MSVVNLKQSMDVQPGAMTRHRLRADMDYLKKIIEECEVDGNLPRATVLKIILSDLEEAINDYILFNGNGTALKAGDDRRCPCGAMKD